MKSYELSIELLTRKDTWPDVGDTPILPPHIKKLSERPKKKRRREPHQDDNQTSRLFKRGSTMTCQRCFQKGHNKRTCPNSGQSTFVHVEGETLFRERSVAMQGYNVFINEETGNTYYRALSVCYCREVDYQYAQIKDNEVVQ
ncbi:hypothetical protein Cni_G02248 [Canna indica]|uniref:CCHC-type domain-containing protein n=1 Tax=Canna indica TaxID=4628 RepID=A0AAQ3PZV2_9LILI|nr:hypothetical protein Cni_G02248 [Canna indica]